MRIPRHLGTVRRLKKLVVQKSVLSASLVQIAKHCGRPGCRCQRGEKHVGNYLTFKAYL